MAKSSTVVIIPTYNEAESIRILLTELLELDADFILVDDASIDGTAGFAKEIAQSRLTVLSRPSKLGLGSAYIAGYTLALSQGYSTLIQMDADGSHQVRDLVSMKKKFDLDQSIDLIIGSRWIPGGSVKNWAKQREYLSRVANKYSKLALGINVNDMTSGFRIYRASLLKQMKLDHITSEGYSFQIEMTREAARMDANIVEYPITFVERSFGKSKMSPEIVREAILKVSQWGIRRLFP